MRNRVESNKRYYDKTRRKVHAGKFVPLCHQPGQVGEVVTCKTCLMVLKSKEVGKRVNEWEQKRLDRLVKQISAERSARWRRENPDKAREATRRWRSNNTDLHRIMCREWSAQNKERRREYNAQWRARNPDYWKRRRGETA